MKENDFSFEKAYERLEMILQTLNENKVSLEDSLTLFEEADSLISFCDHYLSQAEKKIETLIKNRNNQLIFDENGKPATAPFTEKKEHSLSETSVKDTLPF